MTDAVLIFTFSPVQSFIAEARRAADLYVGSQILVQMARAAAQAIGLQHLIYPAMLNGRLPDDVPNVLVARVAYGQAADIAQRAQEALFEQWREFTRAARNTLKAHQPTDAVWEAIWERQANNLWQVFWVAVPISEGGYRKAYQEARDALDAVKHSRVFAQVEEPNAKDSLSGKREALHLGGQTAKQYWSDIARKVTAARLRPDGRERLDAIGATKRFCKLAERAAIVSTSTIAGADFRERARHAAGIQLALYRKAIEEVLDRYLYAPRKHDIQWPYDGDLLFLESLAEERLKDSYHGLERPEKLEEARRALREVYKAAGSRPSPYYAVIVLDGDSMGEHITGLLETSKPEEAHGEFSGQLASFAGQVPSVLGQTFREAVPMTAAVGRSDREIGGEFLIYNGGDDVLALAPLSLALPMAQALAAHFADLVPGCTASAGIAIVHHLYPLDAALAAAREAERTAKRMPDKAAVAITVLKRSGEAVTLRSKWQSLGTLFEELVAHFAEKRLSSRFAYDLSSRAHIVTALPAEARKATLKQLVERHKTDALTGANAKALVEALAQWAQTLDGQTPPEIVDSASVPQGMAELSRWIVFACFVAAGGSE
jgi:CRISPR-associated protein Cmr2